MTEEQFNNWYGELPLLTYGEITDEQVYSAFEQILTWKSEGRFISGPIGTKEYWSQQLPATYIGQYATCEYEVFSKSGIPLKPIFISTRKLDASGNPLE